MGYCAVSDVQPMFPQLAAFGASTSPSLADVQTLCDDDVPNLIDSRLTRYYVTPITGPISLQLMQTVAKRLVAAEVARRLAMGGADQLAAVGEAWAKEAGAVLDQIAHGDILLSDAPIGPNTPIPWAQQITMGAQDARPLFRRREVW